MVAAAVIISRHAGIEHCRHPNAKFAIIFALTLAAVIIIKIHPPTWAADADLSITKGESVAAIRSQQRHWQFLTLEDGDCMQCQINTVPISSDVAPFFPQYTRDENKDQYMIHIHGLHHTGTGYLRQTLHDALNKEFSIHDKNATRASPVASIQDAMRPYQHLLEEAGENKTKTMELNRQYRVPENEGHHLQSIYPRFVDRAKELTKKCKHMIKNAHKLAYLADLCAINNNDPASHPLKNDDPIHFNSKLIVDKLWQQWSRYWDISTTFLLQKTPSMDVLFLENSKVMPTLHVIIARHPYTSNSFGKIQMGSLWLNAWTHVLEVLQTDQIEWYAVVTYEALVTHHDQVVGELLEVVRSGMSRYPNRGRTLDGTPGNKRMGVGARGRTESTTDLLHRRLPFHDVSNKAPLSQYLVPKLPSGELWKKCILKPPCYDILRQLTTNILPYFGFKNLGKSGEPNDSLSSSPRMVGVSREFGRVLFSSEGDALNKFRHGALSELRQYHGDAEGNILNYKPPFEMTSRMKEINLAGKQ